MEYSCDLKFDGPYPPFKESNTRPKFNLCSTNIFSKALSMSRKQNSHSWIFDYGATDTMTFDLNDILFPTSTS